MKFKSIKNFVIFFTAINLSSTSYSGEGLSEDNTVNGQINNFTSLTVPESSFIEPDSNQNDSENKTNFQIVTLGANLPEELEKIDIYWVPEISKIAAKPLEHHQQLPYSYFEVCNYLIQYPNNANKVKKELEKAEETAKDFLAKNEFVAGRYYCQLLYAKHPDYESQHMKTQISVEVLKGYVWSAQHGDVDAIEELSYIFQRLGNQSLAQKYINYEAEVRKKFNIRF